MPRGFSGVRGAAADIENRRNAGSGGTSGQLWFKLKGGESAVVRFLEQGDDFTWAWVHEMPPRGKQRWGDDTPCLDQAGDGTPCPGCEAGLDKKFKAFISMIWREAPVYARDAEGKIIKNPDGSYQVESRRDQVAIWERGITTSQELDGKDATYKGLRSRDFRITRRGSSMNDTVYIIDPADPDSGAVEMTEADVKLEQTEKPDLAEFTTPVTYDQMRQWLGQPTQQQQATHSSPPAVAGADVNPFLDN